MTITLTREEAQQVLDALEGVKDMAWDSDTVAGRKLIKTLRARLAQPEPEPWAGVDFDIKTAPPQREWQGLTDEEIKKLHHIIDWTNAHTYVNFARAIEAKLKEKNS